MPKKTSEFPLREILTEYARFRGYARQLHWLDMTPIRPSADMTQWEKKQAKLLYHFACFFYTFFFGGVILYEHSTLYKGICSPVLRARYDTKQLF